MKALGIVVGAIVAAELVLGAFFITVVLYDRWDRHRQRRIREGELERFLQAETQLGMELLEEEEARR